MKDTRFNNSIDDQMSEKTSAEVSSSTVTSESGSDSDHTDSLRQLIAHGAGSLPGVVVILTLLFLYIPVLVVAYLSVSPSGQPTIPIEELSLRWYVDVLTDQRFTRALMTSVGLGAFSAIGGTTLGLAGAYSLTWSDLSQPTRQAIGAIISLPLFVPTVVLAFGIGVTTSRIGIGFGLMPVAVGHLFWVLPFTTFLLTARYAELDMQLQAAARDLGATEWMIFRTVTLPLLRPAIIASALFAFALSFNEFLITFFLAGSGVTTVPLDIFEKVRVGAVAFLNAASVLVLAISAVLAGVASTFRRPI
ncbi:ABC transporter permease [Haloquadratum walsbyi]|uniref:ABC-type spermidine/putrescine transport system, permease component II n=1 Tax=Haloquadratum walsbyi J07HQW2 TaxID=1238425 RepID=U1PPC2_9EURY|nr:ABC transporter permease [Haloquadratum walsbyi]ERG95592.1 MAG: ABC-type spermidine/putrescine transport system, permease component II [Haloquadratum walsbyi J07HQW2]